MSIFLVMHNSSALEIAAFENKSEDIAKFLLESGANINHCNDKQETALHFSVNRGHLAISKLLLENQANVNAQEQNGLTPLHIATRVNSIPLVELLLNHGSDPNVQDRKLNNCLHYAILRQNVEAGASYPRGPGGPRPPLTLRILKNCHIKMQ